MIGSPREHVALSPLKEPLGVKDIKTPLKYLPIYRSVGVTSCNIAEGNLY
jgi:hypothetical protein